MSRSSVDCCPVCLGPYQDPQLLSKCGHTFCKRCIDQLQPKRCPTCRTAFQAQDARRNYALVRMLEEQALRPSAPGMSEDDVTAGLLQEQALTQQRGSTGRSSTIRRRSTMTTSQEVANNLTSFGVPWGLARLIGEEDHRVAVRVFLLDNSGSTSAYDGAYFEEPAPGGKATKVACSRWVEIQNMAFKQAAFNIAVGTPCEFMLLNPPASRNWGHFNEGVDFVSIDPASGNADAQLASLHRMLERTRPMGTTPLADRIREIKHRIQTKYRHLGQEGMSAIVVVATDGLPTMAGSGGPTEAAKVEVVQALRQLTCDLPIFVVVRLCTDEEDVVAYYNRIDEEEELPLEVIDDLESEAKEVQAQGNGWFTYTPLIHMIREGGTFVKLLDLLDERKLTPLEARLLAGHLLLREDQAPLPLQDASAFLKQAKERVRQIGPVFSPLRMSMRPCIDMWGLRRAARVPGFFMRIFRGMLCF